VNWIPNASAGTFSTAPSETAPEAEASTQILASGAQLVSCSGCSGGEEVGYIGGSAGGTLSFPAVSSTASTTTTIRIHHTNGDSTQRYASVIVNGRGYVVAFLPTGGDVNPGTSILTVPLNSGSSNTIEFEAYNGGWGKFLYSPREHP
jgi:hypothetical protein